MSPLIERLASRLISHGTLLVTDHKGQTHRFGDGTGKTVHIKFNNRKAELAVALDPGLKFGECYMDGDFDMVEGNIYDLLETVFKNSGPNVTATTSWMRGLNKLRGLASRFRQINSIPIARRNVQHHYDLSGKLYDLFLDSDRQYSCAYFRDPQMDLDAAQHAKKEHIAAKLYMEEPGLSVLDIGSGWGGLGLFLARTFEADVTGVTLSDEQHSYSNARIAAHEADTVRFELKDFRAIDAQYDRIVSVGMFEHVGKPNYDEFFNQCAKLLKRDGVMVLHAIGQADVPSDTNPFIARYIFPGGYIASLSEVLPAIERSGLYVTDIEILRLHYAETLKAWRERFVTRWDEAKALYDEAFCRMWEFYLASSETAFRLQKLMVFQIQLGHHHSAVPITRDYITDGERQLVKSHLARDQRTAC